MNKYALGVRDYYWGSPYCKGPVTINHEKLLDFAKTLAAREPKAPNWREPKEIMPQNDKAFACQEFYRSVVNFCYTHPAKPKEKFKIGPWTGSMAMAYCFQREFGNNPITADDIFRICETSAAMEKFFSGDMKLPLIWERRAMLGGAASIVDRHYNGDPLNILIAANYRCFGDGCGRKRGVVDILIEDFPIAFGGDCHDFGGANQLVFAKRAQLWPLLYQGRALDSDALRPLDDVEDLGIPADYQVPKTLRYLGILEYEQESAGMVDSNQAIRRLSPFELGMRMATVAAAVKILEAVNALRPEILPRWTMVELDYELWSAGRAAKNVPHHLTLTTDY